MDDHNQTATQDNNKNNSPTEAGERNEPARTRWSPKPEQILLLENIFNSGMVNPPKDETVRIRKMLQKFGPVGDANIFYWFQNRRSRLRRKQRLMQNASLNCSTAATSSAGDPHNHQQHMSSNSSAIDFNFSGGGYGSPLYLGLAPNSTSCYDGSSSSSPSYGLVEDHCGGSNIACKDEMFAFPDQMGAPEINQSCSMGSFFGPSDGDHLHYYPGTLVTVLINGVATEVPGGPFDMKALFGADVALIHSSGIPIPFNEFGFTLQGLHHGESYFLVSRPT